MKASDIAWAVGLLDGEGCVGIYRHRIGYTLRITIGMVHLPTIEHLQNLFGGSVYLDQGRGGRQRPCWHWYVGAAKAASFLCLVTPYLVTKAEQARLVLDFNAARPSRSDLSRRDMRDWRTGSILTAEELAVQEGYKLALQESKRRFFNSRANVSAS